MTFMGSIIRRMGGDLDGMQSAASIKGKKELD